MRRLILFPCLTFALATAACGDDKDTTPTTTDATTATDATTSEVTNPTATDATTSTAQDTVNTVPTDTGSTSTPDTTTGDTIDTAGTCPGIILCFSECPSPVTQACQQACLAAGSAAEQAAVAGVAQCQVGCFPTSGTPPQPKAPSTNDEWRDTFECLYENCVEEEVACQSGGVFGEDDCLALNNCLVDCDREDIACSRGCTGASTEEAATTLFKLDFCVQSQCYDTQSVPPVSQACATQAQQAQPCSLDYNQCLGNTGAAPAAGGGGGSGKKDRTPTESDKARLLKVLEAYQAR